MCGLLCNPRTYLLILNRRSTICNAATFRGGHSNVAGRFDGISFLGTQGKLSLVPHCRSLVQEQVCVRVGGGGGGGFFFVFLTACFCKKHVEGAAVEGSRTSRRPCATQENQPVGREVSAQKREAIHVDLPSTVSKGGFCGRACPSQGCKSAGARDEAQQAAFPRQCKVSWLGE